MTFSIDYFDEVILKSRKNSFTIWKLICILIFHFLGASRPSEPGVGGYESNLPSRFWQESKQNVFLKRPWITSCPSKFINLPVGLLFSDSLEACGYQPLFASTNFFFLFWNHLQWKPDFTIEAKPVAIIFMMKFLMPLNRFSSTHKSILFFWDKSSKLFLLFSEEGSWENPKSLLDMYIACLYWWAVVTSSVKKIGKIRPKILFSNFSCMFLNPNIFFQFEF